MRRLRYSVPYIAGKNLPKDSDPAPRGAGQSCGTGRPNWPNFNPPAPCGAGRALCVPTFCGSHFNPPAPCGAGLPRALMRSTRQDFNPPAPCGAGRRARLCALQQRVISIHPPLAGRDHHFRNEHTVVGISIHPPLAGRDREWRRVHCGTPISIHPPLRGGTAPVLAALHSVSFQSTRPCGAGHSAPALKNPWKYFNPPALAGRDCPCGSSLGAF